MNRTALTALAWLWVGLPFAYGLYELLRKVSLLLFG
ncbi:MFS transporter small subunit [Saccharopolyspora erythraea]